MCKTVEYEIQIPPLQSLLHKSQICFSPIFHFSDGLTVFSTTKPRRLGIILPSCLNLFLLFNHTSNYWLYLWNSSRILPSSLFTLLWPCLMLWETLFLHHIMAFSFVLLSSRNNKLGETNVTLSKKINCDNTIGKKTCDICQIPVRCSSASKSYACLAIYFLLEKREEYVLQCLDWARKLWLVIVMKTVSSGISKVWWVVTTGSPFPPQES